MDPYKLIKILNKVGFKPVRQRGSYVILMNERRTRIVVPVILVRSLNQVL
ncbi:MAG: hypothetical protein DRO09_00965 [Thermoprotei archaeon]|nr:MAG: hypothetical protein DRO09_00965 [Thermoprotei archaeon]